MKQLKNFSPNYYDDPEMKKKQHEDLIDHLLSSDDEFFAPNKPQVKSQVKPLRARSNRFDTYETTFGPNTSKTSLPSLMMSDRGGTLADAD